MLPLTLPNVRQVNGRYQRLRPRSWSWCLARSASMVRCRNSVKVKDFLNLFFIHSIFVQTLSDMCVLLSPVRQGAAIQPRGWMCVTRLHIWLLRRPVIEWASAAGPHMAWAGWKCWPVDQRFRPAQTRGYDLLVRSPQAYWRWPLNPLTANLINWNFDAIHNKVSENYSNLAKWRSTILNACWFMSRFIFNMFESLYAIS